MTTEFRNEDGEVICVAWYAGSERGACLDFESRLEFEVYNNDEKLADMPLVGSDGTKTTLRQVVRQFTGTLLLPNPRITFGEAPRTIELKDSNEASK